jgi:hypothetical protein
MQGSASESNFFTIQRENIRPSKKEMNNAVTIQSKLPDVCSYAKNQYVSLSLTNRKSSVHLHALYSPRITLRTFTPRRDQLVICGQYILRRQNERDVGHIKVSLYLCKWRRNPHRFSERLLFRIRQWDQELKNATHGEENAPIKWSQ